MERVRLTIIGKQWDAESGETTVEEICYGECGERGGSHYVLYEEPPGDFAVPTKCRLKYKADYVELVKQGPVSTQMFFETGKRRRMYYQTPYGSLPMEIETERIAMEEDAEALRLVIKYRLAAGGEPVSDCHLELVISRV